MSSFAIARARARRLWSLRLPSTCSSVTRFIPRTRCGSSAGRCSGSKVDCAQPVSTGTAAASFCSYLLAVLWLPALAAVMALALAVSTAAAWLAHVLLVYTLLALGDLLHHVWRIESAVRRDDVAERTPRRQRACRPRYRSNGWPGVPACRGREPQRESDRRLREPGVLVRARRGARNCAVQDRQHDGLDGRLQDAAVPAVRLVRRPSRRRDELRAGATDMAGHRGRRVRRARLLGAKGLARRPRTARRAARTQLWMERGRDGRRARTPHRRPDLAEGRSGDRCLGRRSAIRLFRPLRT